MARGAATAYSWFVWFQDCARPAWLRRAQNEIRESGDDGIVTFGIPPGTKARLTRADDVRLWGARSEAPLFAEC